ncbi:ketosynthase chain-length factor [Sphaerisporangium sp. TRM90804]|uniref:ketosynthase chain-length factor n=1 Tax=Sphaerisporangium sp. TRM90804 TaxID=3031113 RepID=UPI00244CC734|nr:ketosynthase chain-length factor [Sphaerisporangium sp. TRM90804]MDH2426176.1 ketosynthase chain-length factor [Sphaerisporangium sp. TRM90804]
MAERTAPATRPVVTGIGVAAPNGLGTQAYWSATLDGKSGIGRITRFDSDRYPVRVGGEVSEFDDTEHVPSRLAVQTDHWSHLGLTAADMALRDAALDPAGLAEYEMAVVTASSSGGTEFGQREIEKLWSQGPRFVGVYQSIAWFYAATTGQISIRYGMRGPCGVICTEQAGGLDVVAQARRLLRQDARMVVSGGTDASLCPYGLVAQMSNGLLSTRDDPERAYLPFDADACGYVPGEGGAMLVLETEAAARARDARPYGAIAGYAATFDPRPEPGGEPVSNLRRAVTGALDEARLTPDQVDVVFADAMAVPERDRLEAQAISAVFGPYGVPVTAPKTMTGRLYAGGAALDLATALLAIRDGVIPPTVGVRATAPACDLDLVRTIPRDGPVRTALVLARGHGGFNAAMVVTAT